MYITLPMVDLAMATVKLHRKFGDIQPCSFEIRESFFVGPEMWDKIFNKKIKFHKIFKISTSGS